MRRVILLTMRSVALMIVLSMSLTGCTQVKQLAHLRQLLTLKGFSQEKKKQTEYIKACDQKFEEMMAVAKDGQLPSYSTQRKVEERFGPPVYKTTKTDGGVSYEIWMYRYAMNFFDSPKIYLYFDGGHNLVKWEKVKAPEKTASSKQTNG